jgi:outer membrane beta-barrel protein
MKVLRWTGVLLVTLAALTGGATIAAAQDSGSEGASAQPTEEGDLDAFWADRRGVRVIQRRMYELDGDVQLSLFFGAIPNDPFLQYFPIGLRVGYWFSNSLALELSGSVVRPLGVETDLASFLDERGNVDVFLRDEQIWRANLAALYSPIYGKFSLAGRKLAHFDWYFGGGVGVVQTRSADEDDLQTQNTAFKPEVTLATGWNIHLSQRFALRVDYRQYIFQKDSGGVTLPSEISLGASVFF